MSVNTEIRERIIANMKAAEAKAIEAAANDEACLGHLKERDRYVALLAEADGHNIDGCTLADGRLADLGVELVA